MTKATMIALGAFALMTGHVGIIIVGFLLLTCGLLVPAETIRQEVRDHYERIAAETEAEEAEA